MIKRVHAGGLCVCATNMTHRGFSVGSQGEVAKYRDVLLCVCAGRTALQQKYLTYFANYSNTL